MAENKQENEATSDITTELDTVIPPHELLDNTAAKHKTELVHRGTLASRHRPSGEGLRTQILRKQLIDSKEGSPDNQCKEPFIPPPPPPSSVSKMILSKSKPGASFLANIQSVQKSKCKDDSQTEEEETVAKQFQEKEKSVENLKDDKGPDYSPSSKPRPSFLAELKNAKKRNDSEEPDLTDNSIKIIRKVKAKPKVNPVPMGKSDVQDQLRLKLEARKKLVEETDEGTETEVCS